MKEHIRCVKISLKAGGFTEKITKSDKKYHLDINHIGNTKDFDGISLVQAGRMNCGEETVIPRHAHIDWFELTIVKAGEGEIVTDDKKSKVSGGDIYLSFPCDMHEIISDRKKPLQFDFFSFKTELSPFSDELEAIMQNFASPDARIFKSERASTLVENIIAELNEEESVLKKEAVSSLLRLILIEIIRSFKGESKKVRHSESSEAFCYQIMNYINTHIYTIKNLSELAFVFDYNYSYISAFFKEHTGETLASYYKRRKIEIAKQLMREGELSESHIAELLGYSTLYAFIKAFKNYTGMAPGTFKKSLK